MKTRVLLSVASAVSFFLVSPRSLNAQGSLTPSGPPAPIMKSLSQIEPRTPVDAVNTPGGGAAQFSITQPGSYYLTGNITGVSGKHGIMIQTNDVTLNLNGFEMLGVSNSFDAIAVASGTEGVLVRNGSLRAWGIGVVDTMGSCKLENVRVYSCMAQGFYLGSSCTVKDCIAVSNGYDGVEVGSGCAITGCLASSNAAAGLAGGTDCVVSGCQANGNLSDGIDLSNHFNISECTADGNIGNGFTLGNHGRIRGCVANTNFADGIFSLTDSMVSECTANANGSGGIFVHDGSTVRDSQASANHDSGIVSSGTAAGWRTIRPLAIPLTELLPTREPARTSLSATRPPAIHSPIISRPTARPSPRCKLRPPPPVHGPISENMITKSFSGRVLFPFLLALGLAACFRGTGQNTFTLYVANYLPFNSSTSTRNYTIEKFDAQGNASVFATNTSFSNPTISAPIGIALDSAGNVFVTCTQDGTWIEKFDRYGNNATRFGNVTLNYPEGMVFDNAGTLYVANLFGSIEAYSPGGTGRTFATTGTSELAGLAIDTAGNIYITDAYNGRVDICDTNGNINTYATPGQSPYGLAFDSSGTLYVGLSGSGNIVKYDSHTNQTLVASLGSSAQPEGMAFDAAGNLYVAEYNLNRIVKIDRQTNVTVFATNGLNGPNFLAIRSGSPTTVDAANHFAYGANIGWMDFHNNGANGVNPGAVIGEYVCSGYVYSANVGWINLGSGAATNGIYYQNLSANDFGVNLDSLGNLNGYAWGANIGWINFESTGSPQVNLQTGIFTGYAYSANCGWISLSNAFAYVQTDTIVPGASTTGDGIPDAWALQNFGTVNINPNADPDDDGMSNYEEYLAGTDPNNGADFFAITFLNHMPTTLNTTLLWTAKPTRSYVIQNATNLAGSNSWSDSLAVGLGVNTATFADTHTNDFYRVRAYRQLTP